MAVVLPSSPPLRSALRAFVAASLFLGAALAHAQQVVKIGHLDLGSYYSADVGDTLDAMRLAADEINASGFEVGGKAVRLEIVGLGVLPPPARALAEPETGLTPALKEVLDPLPGLRRLFMTETPAPVAHQQKHQQEMAPDEPQPTQKALYRFIEARDGTGRSLAGRPDLVIAIAGPRALTELMSHASELGWRGGFIAIDMDLAPSSGICGFAASEDAEHRRNVLFDESDDAIAFTERFIKVHHRSPGPTALLAYTATHAAAVAMKLAGNAADTRAVSAQYGAAVNVMPAGINPAVFRWAVNYLHAVTAVSVNVAK